MKKVCSIMVLLVATAFSAWAQQPVTGVAVDETNIPLPGAVILLDGAAKTYTDAQGRFSFNQVSDGAHSLVLEYPGYDQVTKTIQAGSHVVLKTSLTANTLSEANVVGSYLQGQAKAINKQASNVNTTNVVSSDQVGRFPDDNIGDALKRVSGITMQNDQGEARNIIVRGLAPQLNSVTINGERIPSAEGDNRNIQLDLIGADMIQTLEVNKTLTPDMDADAIGGSVNLVTRAAVGGRRAFVNGGLQYNALRQTTTLNGSFSYADRFAKDRLGLVVSGSRKDNVFGSDNYEMEWDFSGAEPMVTNYEVRVYNVQRLRQNLSVNADYRLAPGHTLFFSSMVSNRKDWENRFRIRFKDIELLEDGTYEGEIRMQTKGGGADTKNARLENQNMNNFALRGEHLFGQLKMDWSANQSFANELRPNERYMQYRVKGAPLEITNNDPMRMVFAATGKGSVSEDFGLHELTEQNQNTFDRDRNARLDFTLPVANGNLKFGARLRTKTKERDLDFMAYEFNNDEPTLQDNALATPRMDAFMPGSDFFAKDGTQRFFNPETLGAYNFTNADEFTGEDVPEEYAAEEYTANENILGAYAMYTRTWKKLTAIGGVRWEQTQNVYSGNLFNLDEGTKTDSSNSSTYNNLLPSLLLKYQVSKNSVVRLAGTSALARPNYYDLVPFAAFSFDDSEASFGNPNLSAARATNVDLSYESYFKNIGLVSVGGFYKYIDNFIYTKRGEELYGGELFQTDRPENGNFATVSGLEVAFQRSLGNTGIWKSFNFYTNGTVTRSTTDGIREGVVTSLAGTAPVMLNASLAYDTKKFMARLSFNHAASYVDEYGGDATEDRFYGAQSFLDFNAYYSLTKKVRIFADVNNLTNQPLRYFQNNKEYTMQAEYYGLRANLGVKWDL